MSSSRQAALVCLLKACSESYDEVRFRYKAIKARAYGLRSLPQHATILIDPAVDILRLDDRSPKVWNMFAAGTHMNCTAGRQAIASVQHLALGYMDFKAFVANHRICQNLAVIKSLKTLFVVLASHSVKELSCRDWPIALRQWTNENITPLPGYGEAWKSSIAEDLAIWDRVWQSLSKYTEFKNRPKISVEFVFLCRDGSGQKPTLAEKLMQDIDEDIELENVSTVLHQVSSGLY